MRLILVRHYKTEFNASRQIMGWGDSPKVKDWLEDVSSVERILRNRAIQPDLVLSSALARSRHTAEYFTEQFAVVELASSPRLNEVDYGHLYEKPKNWVAANYPRHKKDPDFVYPGGESFRQMQQRAVAYVSELARTRAGRTVLCVAHAGVVRALVSHFLELDFTAQLQRRISHRYIGVLEFSGDICTGYDEWGQFSGFVDDGAVDLPHHCRIG